MDETSRATILLLDDNSRIRSFVRPALEDAGFNCIEAEDGPTALEKVDTQRPDLVVLDIILKDRDFSGLDVCKEMRRKGISTPVIFLTIKDRAEDPRFMERAFSLGGDDYVSKREELRELELSLGLRPAEFLERKSDLEELIARIRARKRLSRADFGAVLGVSGQYIWMLERGDRKPSQALVIAISAKFGVGEDWLRSGRAR